MSRRCFRSINVTKGGKRSRLSDRSNTHPRDRRHHQARYVIQILKEKTRRQLDSSGDGDDSKVVRVPVEKPYWGRRNIQFIKRNKNVVVQTSSRCDCGSSAVGERSQYSKATPSRRMYPRHQWARAEKFIALSEINEVYLAILNSLLNSIAFAADKKQSIIKGVKPKPN